MDYLDIQTKLRSSNLSETFPLIRKKVSAIGNWELTEEVENLWNTYQQMLQFMLQGMNDPQSERIRNSICQRLQFAVSRLERLERIKNTPNEKYANARKGLDNIPSFEHLVSQLENLSQEIDEVTHDELLRDSIREHRLEDLFQRHEITLQTLFNWTWTSEVWQHTDTDQANRILFTDSIKTHDKAVFVSAVTLSLFELMDMGKLLFLLDSYLVEDEQISQRALVGFILVCYLHFDEIKHNQDLKDRLNIYHDDTSFVHDVYSTMMQLQMSCTTDSVTSKMRNDIMPALMKGLQKKNKTEQQTIDPEVFIKNGENPEWMTNENMNKKMQEMAEMQLDGSDIYYSTFSMMKGYPFFSQMPHWFYPFSLEDNYIPEIRKFQKGAINKIIRLILNGSPFCNSDKYSLCFTFSNLGNMAESAIEAQINSQFPDKEELEELTESADLQKPKKADIRRQYVCDLYRFYYNYPYKQQFQNPFAILKEHPITPFSNSWLQELLADDQEEMAQYADFLMRKEFYQAALDIFETLAINEFDLSLTSIWQKIGFCHQKLNHTVETIHAYTIANSIKPNFKWTLSHLAALCYTTGKMEDSARYYQELLSISPENQKYLINAAQSLMQCHRYNEAEPLLYKASYLDEQSHEAKQLLAWCLIVGGKNDEAMKLVLEMQATDATNEEADILFAIVLLIDGKTQEAYQRLRHLVNDSNLSKLRQQLNTLSLHQLLLPNTLTLFMDALTLHID
ncbi:MAG: tetratricopeptide repeat protein [Bacteroidaceae bacterium]|nr:tetratricopeptide repeat protein [Bacteroidaceae bacterium]